MKKYTLQIIIGILIFINIISLSYITKLNKKIDINNDYINGLSVELNRIRFQPKDDNSLISDYDLPSYLVIKNGNTEKIENAKGLFNYDRNMSEIINYYGSISYRNEILKLKGNLETNISYLSGSYQDGGPNEIQIYKYTVDILEN
ncbi:hypothetical protein, partial [Clostridium paraputrificum]